MRTIRIKYTAMDVHKTAVEKGWYEDGDRNIGEVIALMHSELSEALEEYRIAGLTRPVYFTSDERGNEKPEGFGVELADCVIRIFDTCENHGIDIEDCIRLKMEYNNTRQYRHGGKKA